MAGFADFSGLGGPGANPQALANAINDPRSILQGVGIQTRFGSYLIDPWTIDQSTGKPQANTSQGAEGEAGISAAGLWVVRFLQPKLVIMTAVGPITVDVTP